MKYFYQRKENVFFQMSQNCYGFAKVAMAVFAIVTVPHMFH